MRNALIVSSVAVVAVLAWASFSARAAEPAAAGGSGAALFEEKCAMCHRVAGMGTGLLARRYPKGQELLEQRTNLSPELVTTVVRNGLGNMPRLSRAEVSDEQLASIVSYLSKKAP